MPKLPVLARTETALVQQELVGAQTRQSWVYPAVAPRRANAKLVRKETLPKVLLAQQLGSPLKMRS